MKKGIANIQKLFNIMTEEITVGRRLQEYFARNKAAVMMKPGRIEAVPQF